MKAIVKFSPDFAPHPIAWGIFSSDPNMHFLLEEFREMDREALDMEPTCSAFAEIHLKSHSVGIKKFGFPITMYIFGSSVTTILRPRTIFMCRMQTCVLLVLRVAITNETFHSKMKSR